MMNRSLDMRRTLGHLRQRITGEERKALLTQVAELTGEIGTLSAQLYQSGQGRVSEVDVADLSDFRLRGGTTASLAEEVRVQAAAGLSTGLIHAQSEVTTRVGSFSKHIQGVLDLPGVHVISPRSELHAELLVIRHPTVISTSASAFERITAERVVVVANHPAVDAEGTWHYSVKRVNASVVKKFGVQPEWAPISQVVRSSILEQDESSTTLAPEDWVNIFGKDSTTAPRTGFVAEKPVIGRHSRPEKEKWPATSGDTLSAYPDSERYRVEVLGGAEVPGEVLGEVPVSWRVQPFGAEEPTDFLQRIDFWVYMHHPDWREAFGRAILEALAAGCVVVLPGYLRAIFGDAALYAEPAEVQGLIDQLWEDPEAFLAQSRRGQQFAEEHGPERHLQRLAQRGVIPE